MGELHLRNATPDAGSEWTDDGTSREKRQLKHRAEGDSRIAPIHPELTRLLRDHLTQFGTAPDGRLFGGVRVGELPTGLTWPLHNQSLSAVPPAAISKSWRVFAATSRIWRPLVAHSRTSGWHPRSWNQHVSARQGRPTSDFGAWGGWDSNPGPADYESAALTG